MLKNLHSLTKNFLFFYYFLEVYINVFMKLKYQILTIDGPKDDKISISIYKNGEYNAEAINNTFITSSCYNTTHRLARNLAAHWTSDYTPVSSAP